MRFIVTVVLGAMFVYGQAADERWKTLNAIGVQLVDVGVYGLAETRLRSALVEAERFGERDYRLWATLSNLAFVCREQGKLAEAEGLYRRVVELRERYLGPEHAAVAGALNNLAATLHLMGRNAEGDPLLRRALTIAEMAEDDHLIASTLNTLALTLMDLGEAARGEPLLRRALAIFEKLTGPDSLDAAKTRNNLGTIYIAEREWGRAESELTAAAAMYEKLLDPEHPLVGKVMGNLYTVLASEKRAEEGEPYLRRAIDIAERASESADTQRLRDQLARLQIGRRNYEAAAAVLKEVVDEQERTWGPNSPQLAAALERYADVLRKMHQTSEAKRAGDRAQAILRAFR